MMSDRPREFDTLLDEFLQHESAGKDDARQAGELPHEVDPEDLQLLRIALDIRGTLAPEQPSEEFLQNSEIRLKNRISARLSKKQETASSRRTGSIPVWRRLLRPVPVIASLVLVLALTLGSIGVVGASAASLPGDVLYPVKRGLERARLAITPSEAGDAALLVEFAGERIEEIEALTAMDRLDDLDQAVQSYLELTDQLSELADDGAEAEQLESELANNVQVLEQVLEQVPPEAQPAIQQAIAQSKETKDWQQEGRPEEPGQGEAAGRPSEVPGQGDEQEAAESEQDQRRADQIAEQYNVSLEAVQEKFEGECLGDWQCVREHFRQQAQNQRFAEQIARQYDVSAEAVLQVYEGTCNFEWPCVRAHFRQQQGQGGPPDGGPPGNGPPEDVPPNN